MTEFKAGDKVRINEGLLEGETGVVVEKEVADNITAVKLDSPAFAGGPLMIYTDTLVKSTEEHEALKAVKLYPDLLNSGDYFWQITTVVGGIMYQSLVLDGETVRAALQKPPAGLWAVGAKEKETGNWRLIWQES